MKSSQYYDQLLGDVKSTIEQLRVQLSELQKLQRKSSNRYQSRNYRGAYRLTATSHGGSDTGEFTQIRFEIDRLALQLVNARREIENDVLEPQGSDLDSIVKGLSPTQDREGTIRTMIVKRTDWQKVIEKIGVALKDAAVITGDNYGGGLVESNISGRLLIGKEKTTASALYLVQNALELAKSNYTVASLSGPARYERFPRDVGQITEQLAQEIGSSTLTPRDNVYHPQTPYQNAYGHYRS
jgi:hypothetical protein